MRAGSCSHAVSKHSWHIPLLCVQWKTPDGGERNCPKHVDFYSKNKIWEISASSWLYYKNVRMYFWFHANRQGSSSVVFCTSSCKLRHLISSPTFVGFALPLIFWYEAYRHLNHTRQPFCLPVYAKHTYWSVLVWLRHQSLPVHSSVTPSTLTSPRVCVCVNWCTYYSTRLNSVASRGGWFGDSTAPPPAPKFRRPSKIVPNSTRFENC